jgi:hypothetical protein
MNTNLAAQNIAATTAAANTVAGFPINMIMALLVGLALVGGLVFYYISQKESNPWYSKRVSWMNYLFGSSDETPVPQKVETWCFVGEDNTGRWCVQVPLPSLCEPIRSYGTRSSCEMTLAQQLPSGVNTNGGTTPMASLSVNR